MVKLQISSLKDNSVVYELDTFKQEQVKGGDRGQNSGEFNGAKLSILDSFNISFNSKLIPNLPYKPSNFTLISIREKLNFNPNSSNQVITTGDAQVFINGEKM